MSENIGEATGSPVSRTTPLAMVREFHATFALPIGAQPKLPEQDERDLRSFLLDEEFSEYCYAEGENDLVAIADALGDMVCVIYGTALSYGINLDAVVAEIHRSNMTKERHPTQAYPSKNVVKGPSYEPPNIAAALTQEALPPPEVDSKDTDTVQDALTVAHSGFKLGAEAGRHPNSGDTIYTRALAALARLVAERAALEAERDEAEALVQSLAAENEKLCNEWAAIEGRYVAGLVAAEERSRLQAEALSRVLRWIETGRVSDMDTVVNEPHRSSCRPWHSDGCRCGNETMQELLRDALTVSEAREQVGDRLQVEATYRSLGITDELWASAWQKIGAAVAPREEQT